MRTLVMVSGRGSNLLALLQACEAGQCAAEVVAVLSDRCDAGALEVASQRNIPTEVIAPRAYPDRDAWDHALADAAAARSPELIVLAGFMRILGPAMIERFPRRIVNVHPSLLPAFPGKDGPALALAAGVTLSGCTVHVVDASVDGGPILAQAAVPVLPADDRDALHARIQRAEHQLLPRVVHAVAQGRIRLDHPPVVATPGREDELPEPLLWPPLS